MGASIENIVREPNLKVREKAERVTAFLHAQNDLGVQIAVSVLLTTEDPKVASFVANYLSLLPGLVAEKRRVAERLLDGQQALRVAATRLVRFLSDGDREILIKSHLEDQFAYPDAIFEIASFFPTQLRKFENRIEDHSLRTGMLSGAPPDWAHELEQLYVRNKEPSMLGTLARFHTGEAAQALLRLRSVVPKLDENSWTMAIENAGLAPDAKTDSIYRPSFEGYVVERHQSPHLMGGATKGVVPSCPTCNTPAGRLLTLKSSELPFGLCSDRDLSFYWYNCKCDTLHFVNVQIIENSLKVLIGTEAEQDGLENKLVPGERSLVLVEHPNQSGISIDASPGLSRHQVGGFPNWVHMESFPVCLLCQKPMRFVAAIDSGMTPFGRIDVDGIIFCFWCNLCATSTTFKQ